MTLSMETQPFSGFIPVMTTPAGCCLTSANWEETHIEGGSFHLSSLLMKPGYDFLMTLPSLAAYVGWQHGLVLHAGLPPLNSEDQYVIHSVYDGRKLTYTVEEILTLIAHLQPQVVLLPQGLFERYPERCEDLSRQSMVFLPASERQHANSTSVGVYIEYSATMKDSESYFLKELQQFQGTPCYVFGDLPPSFMLSLRAQGIVWMESDRPARDGYTGVLYAHDGVHHIEESCYADMFLPIDSDCECPTCTQKLTLAYLHHLLAHTPLLAQRFLIQHNVFYSMIKFLMIDFL